MFMAVNVPVTLRPVKTDGQSPFTGTPVAALGLTRSSGRASLRVHHAYHSRRTRAPDPGGISCPERRAPSRRDRDGSAVLSYRVSTQRGPGILTAA